MAVVIPEIERVTSVDGYRDGGSLSVSFKGCVGESYTLFFRVIGEYTPDFNQIGFSCPKLTAYYPYEWKSKITGYVHSESTEKLFSISWQEASVLLNNMKILINSFKPRYILDNTSAEEIKRIRNRGISDYHRMVEIAKNKGDYRY